MNIVNRNLKFEKMDYRKEIDLIVLHHAADSTCSLEDIHKWHMDKGWEGIGYHYFIAKDGTVFKGRPDTVVGAHCKGHNDKSIGVCMQGNFMVEHMSGIQYKSLEELIHELCEKYKIKVIKKHKDLSSTQCPGINFPCVEIKGSAFKEIKQSNMYKVKAGDTLWSIATKYNISVSELKKNNEIQDNLIRKNQIIKIFK